MAETLTEEQKNIAMKDPEHLKLWLRETGRTFLTFNALELVDALPWPGGAEALMQVIMSYRDHRRVIETGRFEQHKHPDDPTAAINVPIYKTEFLELDEADRAVRELVSYVMTLDPTWSLENAPL